MSTTGACGARELGRLDPGILCKDAFQGRVPNRDREVRLRRLRQGFVTDVAQLDGVEEEPRPDRDLGRSAAGPFLHREKTGRRKAAATRGWTGRVVERDSGADVMADAVTAADDARG